MDLKLKNGPLLGWQRLERWFPAVIVAFALLSWECLVRAGLISSLFFPAPSTCVVALVRLIASGDLAVHVGNTVSRVFLGFVLCDSNAQPTDSKVQ